MRIRSAALAFALLGFLLGGAPSEAFAQTGKPAASAKPDAKAPAKASAAKPASNKTPAKATASKTQASKPGKKGGKRPMARKPGSEAGDPDEATRKIITGNAGPAARPGERAESPELRAMRDLDLALFPAAAPQNPAIWPSDTIAIDRDRPNLIATGAPPLAELAPLPSITPVHDLGWIRQLEMPDIPVRWDARVVRYLEFYKDNARGRSMVAGWIKKSGRYGGAIRRVLREEGVPEDVLWLALVESGFDPTISSPAGAAGLWQFMPEGARIYGLTVDRWIDERLDPERATVAAAKYLADLHKRFGGWELAFAAYNMGYGGLLSSIRKYNTNDFWELSRYEAGIPYETALYVPKIVAMAIVARNKKIFGVDDVDLDPAITFDRVAVGSGVSIHALASAAGTTDADVQALNPQVLATRTPPIAPGGKEDASWVLRVPPGTAPRAAKSVGKLAEQEGKLERYLVRWGESIDEIAAVRKVTRSSIVSLNGLRREEVVRPGTVLFVPSAAGTGVAAAAENVIASGLGDKPVVVIPAEVWSYVDRRRVFYRPVPGDTLRDVANVFSVSADEVARWNSLDAGAALHDGMALQIWVAKDAHLDGVIALEEKDARVLTAGSEAFFTYFEAQKGRRRVEIVAREGDSFRSLAKRYNLSLGMLERINQRSRSGAITAGEKIVVYVASSIAPPTAIGVEKPNETEAGDVAGAPKDPLDDDVYDGVIASAPPPTKAILKSTTGAAPSSPEPAKAPIVAAPPKTLSP